MRYFVAILFFFVCHGSISRTLVMEQTRVLPPNVIDYSSLPIWASETQRPGDSDSPIETVLSSFGSTEKSPGKSRFPVNEAFNKVVVLW